MKRIAFIIIIIALFIGVQITSSVKASDKIKIRLLQTTDIHGHYLRQKRKDIGGWLRVATLIKQARYQNPNNLLIDCGDTIQGSAMASIERGEIAVEFLNRLKYDAWILGNHELDFGLTHLNKLIEKTKIPIISGNFSFRDKKFPAWKIYNKEGAKIAIIGLQVAYLRHWFIGKDYEDFQEVKGYAIVKKSLEQLRSLKPDIIILAAHQGCVSDRRGVNEINKICRDFPEIDIVLGGHTHRDIAGQRINQSYYMQAGAHANNLGVMDIIYDKLAKKITSIQSHLVKTSTSNFSYGKKLQSLEERLNSVKQKVDRAFVELPKKLTPSTLAKLTSQAIHSKTKADFALSRRFRYGLPKGDINLRHLFRLFPYENRLFTIEVNQFQLTEILQEQKSNNRRQQLWRNGQKIKKVPYFKGTKRLAMNSYTAAGAGRYPKLTSIISKNSLTLTEYPFIIRHIVRDYLILYSSKFTY